jgi:hypothetical protein
MREAFCLQNHFLIELFRCDVCNLRPQLRTDFAWFEDLIQIASAGKIESFSTGTRGAPLRRARLRSGAGPRWYLWACPQDWLEVHESTIPQLAKKENRILQKPRSLRCADQYIHLIILHNN